MKLAFCLFNYFPYGGLQRDFLRIAEKCQQRGHEIHVYTMRWRGDSVPGFHVHIIKPRGWQNHTRCTSYAKKLAVQLKKHNYDVVIGFNKMPGLDIYFAADVCYQARIWNERSAIYRLLPRYRHLKTMEQAVFARGKSTEILLISPFQQQEFEHFYQTESERFHLLPPGIAKDRMAPPDAAIIRQKVRERYYLSPHHFILLMVGSGFKTKGLDRSLHALAALPQELRERCRLFVIGQDNPRPYQALIQQLDIASQIRFLGGRDDVPQFLLAADLLLHPSYHENTGTVILEALVAGLPVLTVESCGYAHYIREANSGMVLPAPFQQTEMNTTLQKMLLSANSEQWQQNALAFAKEANLYSMPDDAVNFIEQMGQRA